VAANGVYSGAMVMGGTYTIPGELFSPNGEGADINWSGGALGPLDIDIQGGVGSGTWELNGSGIVTGTFPSGVGPAQIEGTNSFGGTGTLEGSFMRMSILPVLTILNMSTLPEVGLSTIELEGEVWSEAEITTSVLGTSTTRNAGTTTNTSNMVIYYQAGSCTQIQGGWTENAEAELEARGIRPNFSGTWFVIRDDALSLESRDEIQAHIDYLTLESIQIRNALSSCEDIDYYVLTEFAIEAHALLDSIQTDLTCEYTNNRIRYLYPVTYATCMTMATYLLSTCENHQSTPEVVDLVAMSAIGLGCMGQDFFTSDPAVLAAFENRLLDMLAGLDLTVPEDVIIAEKITATAQNLGLESVIDAVAEAYLGSSSPPESEE